MFTLTKENVTRDQLLTIPIPERSDTSRWKGIQHGHLANTIIDTINNSEFCDSTNGDIIELEPINETWTLASEQQTELFGSIELRAKRNGEMIVPANGELSYTLGVVHSNMSKKSLQFYVGAKVLVCSNGMIADHAFDATRRKHTLNLDLEYEVSRGLINYVNRMKKIEEMVNRMKITEISETAYNKVLISSAKRGIIAWSGLGKVDKLWNNPPHPEFTPKNLWSLYNAYTEVAKDMSPTNQIRTIGGVHWSFTDAGLAQLPEHAKFN